MEQVIRDLIPLVAPRPVRIPHPSDATVVLCARDVTCDLVPFAAEREIRVCGRGGK